MKPGSWDVISGTAFRFKIYRERCAIKPGEENTFIGEIICSLQYADFLHRQFYIVLIPVYGGKI